MCVCVCGRAGVFAEFSVMAATPERIELENCRRSSTEAGLCEEAELHEISEETLNQFNLNVEQKQEERSETMASTFDLFLI